MNAIAIATVRLAALAGLVLGFATGRATSQELGDRRTTANERTAHSEIVVSKSNAGASLSYALKSSVADEEASKTPVGESNPLWSFPLSTLAFTRERPVFSPSRRPPPALGAPPVQAPSAGLSNQPRGLNLALVGAIAGDSEGIAIFVDETTKNIVRLKTGEGHLGWTLSQVRGREATMQHDQETATIAIANAPAR